MLELLSLMAVGFFFGMRHATDADHVVAIATIVTRERSLGGAVRIGLLWGVGHSVTVALVGALIILFGVVIPPRVGLAVEFAVGIMLVILGLFTLRAVALQAREALSLHLLHGHHDARAAAARHGAPGAALAPGPALATGASTETGAAPATGGGAARMTYTALDADGAPAGLGHTHVHVHGDYIHAHSHGHAHGAHGHPEHATPQGWLDRHFGGMTAYQALRPVIVGVVHGLAGSAAVALLVLASIRDPWWGMAYLLVFGVGTIAGMMLITGLIAVPFTLGPARMPAISAGVRAVAGVLSLAFGLFLMYQIGLVDGLFGELAGWAPR